MNDDLKDMFQQLRAREHAEAPPFAALLTPSPRPRRLSRTRAAVVTTALAAGITAVLLWPRHTNDDVVPLIITEWRAPTDFLLQTPNSELMRELPALDASILDLEAL